MDLLSACFASLTEMETSERTPASPRGMKCSFFILLLFCVSLVGCGQGYKQEKGKWVWVKWDEGTGRRVETVYGADNVSFHPLNNPEYGVDTNSVYHRNLKIENADPTTFRPIKGYYWRDAKRVFFVDHEIPGADPDTFQPMPKYPWGRDKRDVYSGTIPLHVRDISTFQLLQGVWGKDSKAYYAANALLQSEHTVPCDYETFVILNGSYAKDKNRGYWEGVPIEGSDAPSFESPNQFWAKDKYREYRGSTEKWETRKK